MIRAATLSGDGTYRYTLTRQWEEGEPGTTTFVMLNPSTADHEADDPTIRRCIAFAKREGAGRLLVVNLFALRATDPKELWLHADPVGPFNDTAIESAVAASDLLVAAWGASPAARPRARATLERLSWATWHCLGRTLEGAPRHPLYLRADTPFEVLT